MEVNEDNLKALANYLQQTMSGDEKIRKPAEAFLKDNERTSGYSLLLLALIDRDGIDLTIRIAGAITFKNFAKRNWKIDEDGVNSISMDDRRLVKQNIVNLMLKSPDLIQKQLTDAISVIGRQDFPMDWPELINEMVLKFGCGDFHIINGILQTAHSLFKRYRYEFKSQALWTEIKFVLEKFAKPLTELFVGLMGLAKEHENNFDALKIIYSSLIMVGKIFHSLNFQDLPEFFEDNMKLWMENFHQLLINANPLLKTRDDEEAGLLEQLKSVICENIGMYAQKYGEEFGSFVPSFVQAVWNLLVTTGNQPKYDILVSNAIQFLAMVADRDQYKKLFEDESTMNNICEKVIIPNMEFRVSDEELFEDNPEEFIRKDLEGSDVDTRRRAACDLVRSLSRHFEQKMTLIFGQYVQAILLKHAENPAANWKNKDTAIYLVTSLSSKGQTQKHGVTQTNQLVNNLEFYQTHILPELANPNVNELPVLKADAIKYLLIFRNQLPQNIIKESIPYLIRFLKAESQVTTTYAASALDKILLIKQADKSIFIKSDDLKPYAADLLSSLFAILEREATKENEHVMKTIMRSFSTLQEGIIPFMEHLLPKLTAILLRVAKNPSKPHFNHFMFESLSLCVRIMCKANPASIGSFEATLFPVFQQIIQSEITEFIPYVFQIFSLLLNFHTERIPELYMALFPFLLTPILWEKAGYIHPLVKLLEAFIEKGPQQILATDKLNAILGTFQKLIASKIHDHEGFSLIQTMIEYLPGEALSSQMRQVFVLLFTRLTSSKTVKFTRGLIVFFSSYTLKYGSDAFITMIDSIQPKMFGMVLDRLFIEELQKISDIQEKKICSVAVTQILCNSTHMINGQYVNYWAPLLQSLIGLFELPEAEATEVEEHFFELAEENTEYEAAFSQLVFVGKKNNDPLKGKVPNVKIYLVENLGKLSVANPGKIQPLITSGIAQEAQNFLVKYLQSGNVQLN